MATKLEPLQVTVERLEAAVLRLETLYKRLEVSNHVDKEKEEEDINQVLRRLYNDGITTPPPLD